MSDSYEKATIFCDCHVHGVTGVDELVDLMNRGYSQRDVSRALWSPESAVANEIVVEILGAQAAAFVRRELLARSPWLKLEAVSA